MDSERAPYSVEAEQSVLGGLLLKPDSWDIIADMIAERDFYRAEHQLIFRHIARMNEHSKQVDVITVAESLESTGKLDKVGGLPYLGGLAQNTPSAANIRSYAQIVRSKRKDRDFQAAIADLNTISAGAGEIGQKIENAVNVLNALADDKQNEPLRLSDAASTAIESLERRYAQGGEIHGLKTGLIDIDRKTGGLQPGDLIILAGRPSSGKTSLSMNIAEHVAIADGIPVMVFSLEMSDEQLATRAIANQGGVSLNVLRSAKMQDEDWNRLTHAVGKMQDAPMFIDSNPASTAMQMHVRARRIKRQHGLGLIVIDYLQLMEGGGENRNNELSIITRRLKMMAKDLNVPVICLSQLSRKVEDRLDKRPMMSDLRDCLCAATTKLYACNGVQTNAESLISSYSLNSVGAIDMIESENIPKGTSEVIDVTLRSGRAIRCTPNHLILTDKGWIKAKELTVEHAIACAHKINAPQATVSIPHARWMGWMLGNGSMRGYSSPTFICSDILLANEFIQKTQELFLVTPKPHKHKCKKVYQFDITYSTIRTAAGNACKDWLREHDMWGRISHEKFIPEWFMRTADNNSMAELIGGLIDTDGCVPKFGDGRFNVKFSTTSLQMAQQVLFMFSRLGVFARMDGGYLSDIATKKCYTVVIAEGDELRKLQEIIKLTGVKGEKLKAIIPGKGSNHGNRLGKWVGKELVSSAREAGISQKSFGYRDQGTRISHKDLKSLLRKLPSDTCKYLRQLVNDSVYWDRLKTITTAGTAQLFDRHVPIDHNFIANGIIVHNSGAIEQDADLIIMLYRDDYYNPDSHNKGVAEANIVKHRMGETGLVLLTFAGEYSKFASFAGRFIRDEPKRGRHGFDDGKSKASGS